MKNWADIEETLPQKISLKKDSRLVKGWWNYSKDLYRWRILYKVVRKHLGQDFDKVFSLICHKFPRNDWGKEKFLYLFEEKYPYLMIDENNRVVLTKYGRKWSRFEDRPKKEFYTFKSHDFKEQVFYKYKGNKRWTTEGGWYVKPIATKVEIVSGYKKDFTSKNDPELKRLNAEKNQLYHRRFTRRRNRGSISEDKFREILQKWKENCELNQSKQAERIREAKRKNLEIIERLGFDPETSFKSNERKIKTKNI